MTIEEKINELENTYPVNSLGVNKDELCAYKQGIRCGAYNMAEWKDQEEVEHSDIDFIKVCHFLLINGIDLDMFDWRKMSFKYKDYIRKQPKVNE